MKKRNHKDEKLILEIKEYAEDYLCMHQLSPSLSMIADHFGVNKSTIYRYLVEMDKRGLIHYDGKKIESDDLNKHDYKSIYTPLLGSISCGDPLGQKENIETMLNLPCAIFGEEEMYILKANGDSMIGKGIDDGDLLVIRRNNNAKIGDVVVALTEMNENTLKTLKYDRERKCYYLHPENSKYEDIYPSTLQIQGVLSHIIKKF